MVQVGCGHIMTVCEVGQANNDSFWDGLGWAQAHSDSLWARAHNDSL